MEFVKVDKDLHKIMIDNKEVGKIERRYTCNKNPDGYYIEIVEKVQGFRNFGGYASSLKNSKALAESEYKKMLECKEQLKVIEENNKRIYNK